MRLLRAAVLVLCALFSACSSQAALKWQSTGPGGGGAFASPAASALKLQSRGRDGSIFVASDLSGVYRSVDDGETWSMISPRNGLLSTHVDAIAPHPDDDATMILAAENGLYVSHDCASTAAAPCRFERRIEAFLSSAVWARAADGHATRAYAAGLERACQAGPRLWRSDDNAATWSVAAALGLPANANIMAIRPQPGNPQVLVVISSGDRFAGPSPCGSEAWPVLAPNRAFLSQDGGESFVPLTIPTTISNLQQSDGISLGPWAYVEDVAFDAATPSRIWATVTANPQVAGDKTHDTNGELWMSDGRQGLGQNFLWQSGDHTGWIWPLSTGSIRVVDVRRQRPWDNAPYAKQSETGFWQWQADSNAWQRTTSDDSYATWTTGWTGINYAPRNSLNGSLQTFTAIDDATVWWVDEQFVFKSPDAGRSLEQKFSKAVEGGFISRGINNAVTGVLAPSRASPDLLFAGYFDMGCWRTSAARAPANQLAWRDCNGPKSPLLPGAPVARSPLNGWWEGWGGDTTGIAPDPEHANIVWAVHSPHNEITSNDERGYYRIAKSTDGGETWVEVTGNLNALSGNTAIADLALSVDGNGARHLWAIAGNRLYRAADGGSEWRAVNTGKCEGGLLTMAVNSPRMLVGGSTGICWSSDGGSSWHWWANALTFGPPNPVWWNTFENAPRGVTDFAKDPANPLRAWATVMIPDYENTLPVAGLYATRDGGKNWKKVKGLAAGPHEQNFLRTVAVNPKDANMIVAGSSPALFAGGYEPGIHNSGAWVSRDGGKSWSQQPENDGLAWPFITRLRFTSGERPRLYGISPGQGIVFTDDF